MYLSKWVFDML